MKTPDCREYGYKKKITGCTTEEYVILDITEAGSTERPVEVSVEGCVSLFINDEKIASMSITPVDLEAFACGYAICEGIVRASRDISDIRIDGTDIMLTIPGFEPGEVTCRLEMGSSGGMRMPFPNGLQRIPDTVGITLPLGTLFEGLWNLHRLSATWQVTGGTHTSIVVSRTGELVSAAEDMGRHNSLDKAVGKALLAGADLSRCFLICTGRLPAGMVAKAYRAGVTVVASNTAPFSAGIDLARELNLTLAGFVRPPRAMIYSAPHRILLPERHDPSQMP